MKNEVIVKATEIEEVQDIVRKLTIAITALNEIEKHPKDTLAIVRQAFDELRMDNEEGII